MSIRSPVAVVMRAGDGPVRRRGQAVRAQGVDRQRLSPRSKSPTPVTCQAARFQAALDSNIKQKKAPNAEKKPRHPRSSPIQVETSNGA